MSSRIQVVIDDDTFVKLVDKAYKDMVANKKKRFSLSDYCRGVLTTSVSNDEIIKDGFKYCPSHKVWVRLDDECTSCLEDLE